jgi:RNA polymerase sigma-70 factor, ECF subfamily
VRSRENTEGGAGLDTAKSKTAIRLATFDQYRGLLFSVAYRMLGSISDTEDMLQETFIRWQQAPDCEIRSPRAFLVTIISRLCINYLRSARVQREEYAGQWLPEPLVTDSKGDPFHIIRVDESLSMAFLVLLERLTPVERAVFLLREVFEYEYDDISAVVGQSAVNCRQIMKRAHKHVDVMRPRFQVPERKKKDLLDRFLEATTDNGDMKGLLSLLAKDVRLYADGGGKGVSVPNLISGADRVARAVLGGLKKLVPADLVRQITVVNGEPGVVSYRNGKPFAVTTIEYKDGLVHAIYVVTNPDKLAHIPSVVMH